MLRWIFILSFFVPRYEWCYADVCVCVCVYAPYVVLDSV
jgi:hypothetical protein